MQNGAKKINKQREENLKVAIIGFSQWLYVSSNICLIREFLFSGSCVHHQAESECMCVFFKGQHIGEVMEDDSFPFLIAMVPVAGRGQTQIFSNEY